MNWSIVVSGTAQAGSATFRNVSLPRSSHNFCSQAGNLSITVEPALLHGLWNAVRCPSLFKCRSHLVAFNCVPFSAFQTYSSLNVVTGPGPAMLRDTSDFAVYFAGLQQSVGHGCNLCLHMEVSSGFSSLLSPLL